MGLQDFAQKIFSIPEPMNWFGETPDSRLEQKLLKLLPSSIPKDAEFIQLNYSLLEKLIHADAVSRDYDIIQDKVVKKGSFTQQVSPITEHDQELIEASMSQKIPREVLRISIYTESNEWYHSDIIMGNEKLVGNPIAIMDWIHEHTFYIRKLGHSIRSLHVDHVHPSLEAAVITEEKTITITNGLSQSDYEVGLRVSEYQMYPLFLSAIIPSGLKYTIEL